MQKHEIHLANQGKKSNMCTWNLRGEEKENIVGAVQKETITTKQN